jgi:hypothetical protein
MTRFWHYAVYLGIFVALGTLVSRVTSYTIEIDIFPENWTLSGLVFYIGGMGMTYSLATMAKLNFKNWCKVVWYSTLFMVVISGIMAGLTSLLIVTSPLGLTSHGIYGIVIAYVLFVVATILYGFFNMVIGYFVAKNQINHN